MGCHLLLAGAPTGCWTNAGDEAIFAAMLAALRREMPDASITVVSSNREGFVAEYGCREVAFNDLAALSEAVAASDLLILGSGSIFFDIWGCEPQAVLTPQHEGLSLWAGLALLARAHHTPLMVYAAGLGPLDTEAGRMLAGTVMENAHVVTARDSASLKAMAALGAPKAKLKLSADPVVGVELAAGERSGKRPLVGVALRPWDVGCEPEDWQKVVAKALDHFARAHDAELVFVPLHRSVDWPLTDDTGTARAVCAMLSKQVSVRIEPVDTPWEQRAQLLGACDLVLAQRLHAAVFAHLAGVPTVALAYDPKVEAAMQEWQTPELAIALAGLSAEALGKLLQRAFSERKTRAVALRKTAKTLIRREALNATLAATWASRKPRARVMGKATCELLEQLLAKPEKRSGEVNDLLSNQAKHRPAAKDRDAKGLRPRVAILTNRLLDWETGEPCFGGAERYVLDLCRLLDELGLDPHLFQMGPKISNGEYFGYPVKAIPPGEVYSEFHSGVCDEFHRLSVDFDHVLIGSPNYASGRVREDAVVICHGVWWDHDLYEGLFAFRSDEWSRHLRRVFEQPARVVCVDANSINVIRARWPELVGKLQRIPNYVDVQRFTPPAEPRSGKPLVLLPRRAEIVRGTRLVGPMLQCLDDDCRVLWLGDGYPDELAVLREAVKQDPRLRMARANFEQMPAYYRRADICVIPSVASEGTSLACLEAMASGCAVVATHVGALPELITDGVNGLLCPPRAEALADGVRRLLRDADLRHRLGANARLVAERYSLACWRQAWAHTLVELGWVARDCLANLDRDKLQPAADAAPALRSADPSRTLLPDVSADAADYDVICFPIINWEFRWQRPQQLMAAWAKRGRRVFYLRITDFLPAGGELIQTRLLQKNIWEVRVALPAGFDVYKGTIPDGFVAAGLEALRALRNRFGITRAISMVEKASWVPLALVCRKVFNWTLVYDCMDDWRTFPGIAEQSELLALEDELVSQADLLVVSSETIAARWRSTRQDLLLARNAADFDFFNNAQGEDPLPDVKGPIAGYFGAIASWFDLDLIIHAAKVRPEVQFVLVGEVFDIATEALENLPNVHLTGPQPYATMPAYLRRFDVCLIPFQVTDATAGMDVVKFYEYIAQGKPVVSTPIQEIIRYDQYLYLAEDQEAFMRQLDRALAEDNKRKRSERIKLAGQHTWTERLERMETQISKTQREKSLGTLLAAVARDALRDGGNKNRFAAGKALLEHRALRLQEENDALQQALSIFHERLAARNADVAQLSGRLEGQAAELRGRDAHILGQQDAIRALEQTRGEERPKFKQMQGEVARAQGELAASEGERARVQGELTRSEGSLARVQGELAASESERARVQGELTRSEGNLARVQSELAASESERAEVHGELTRSEGNLAGVHSELATSESERTKVQDELTRSEAHLARVKGELRQVQVKLTGFEGDLARMQGELTRSEGELAVKDDELIRWKRSRAWRLANLYGRVQGTFSSKTAS